MILASKTLLAIETALQKDQGAKYRGLLGQLMPLAGDAYSTKEESFRAHLGASLIGRECARELWYSFHWCLEKKFDGRMLRLFNRGHLEEPRFVALLKMIGCQVWQQDENGKQFRITGHRGHFGGSMDCVVSGIPDIPGGEPAIGEFKTHGEKSFIKLQSEGVISAKWEHFVQMQIYMGKNSLKWAIYCAVNKNTDELHMEIIPFDPVQYQRYLDRSAMVIDSIVPPPRINESPGFFKCKFCDFAKLCHFKEQMPHRNCRTCVSSAVVDGGLWVCKNEVLIVEAEMQGWEDPIELNQAAQFQACEHYEMNPAIKK